MQLFTSQNVYWWTANESCGLLVDYCDVFISWLKSRSDGTHSLQSIHCWVIYSVRKQTHLHLAWPEGRPIPLIDTTLRNTVCKTHYMTAFCCLNVCFWGSYRWIHTFNVLITFLSSTPKVTPISCSEIFPTGRVNARHVQENSSASHCAVADF